MITIEGLGRTVRATPEILRIAIGNRTREIEVVAVSYMKLGMTQSVSPDGTAYMPLRRARIRGGDKPLLDRGILRASLAALATMDDLTLSANAPGARVHHFGATITAKPGKALAIPLTKAALYAGSPRNMPGLFAIKGGLALREETRGRRGKYGTRVGAKITMQYLFRKSVTIPARPYLGLSADAVAAISYIYVAEVIYLYTEKASR